MIIFWVFPTKTVFQLTTEKTTNATGEWSKFSGIHEHWFHRIDPCYCQLLFVNLLSPHPPSTPSRKPCGGGDVKSPAKFLTYLRFFIAFSSGREVWEWGCDSLPWAEPTSPISRAIDVLLKDTSKIPIVVLNEHFLSWLSLVNSLHFFASVTMSFGLDSSSWCISPLRVFRNSYLLKMTYFHCSWKICKWYGEEKGRISQDDQSFYSSLVTYTGRRQIISNAFS